MNWWPWCDRYVAVTVGDHSGHVRRVDFVRFRRRAAGERWCAEMNEKVYPRPGLVHWELREL